MKLVDMFRDSTLCLIMHEYTNNERGVSISLSLSLTDKIERKIRKKALHHFFPFLRSLMLMRQAYLNPAIDYRS